MRWLTRVLAALALTLSISTAAVAAGPDGSTPGTGLPLANSATGTITGSGAGSFNYYTFQYPGDNSYGTISVSYSPTDQPTANAFGVSLYQGDVLLNKMNGISPTIGMSSMQFTGGTKAGPILVQVYNYNSLGTTVSYTITLSGVNQAPPAAAPTPAAAPAPDAVPAAAAGSAGTSASSPASLDKPVSDTLKGSSPSGLFAYFTLSYPGDDSLQAVNLDFAPGGEDVGNAVIVTLYQNGVQLASVNAGKGATPGHLAVSFSSTSSAPVLVQLANYNNSTITYTMSH